MDVHGGQTLRVLGLMSGTSLDGIDLADCSFVRSDNRWNYQLHRAVTLPYPDAWKRRLSDLFNADARSIFKAHAELGTFYGACIKEFIGQAPEKPHLIASHGHTLFHNPSQHYTVQIGSGAGIAAGTGIDTVCDFRSKDIALGGQGAPLVPIGDALLFSDYEACLNIGGIINVSMQLSGGRSAWDISIANMALNHLAERVGLPYDKGGELARSGSIDQDILRKLQALPYHQQAPPKSLGREWFEQEVAPLLVHDNTADLSATVCELIALETGKALQKLPQDSRVLTTGGGVHHKYLVSRIEEHTKTRIVVPDDTLADYKEAVVFAFLGALYIVGNVNVLSEATGSSKNHIGGALYKGG
ncbi:MAG: anhydro-N-acetylmuramic acid kinase [Sphingobacteriales bacterium]|nr:anhydro-N-acetylmuramic acid kinase [Sphingobacteriales bacterium]